MNILQNKEKYSLSDKDIKKAFKPKKINIIQYQDLPKYNSIDELFKGSDYTFCVMFFPENLKENSGHWTCIIKHTNGKYEYFDSYKDYGPDKELKWLSNTLKKELHFTKPFLTELFKKSNIQSIIVNHFPFQSQKNGINTCGREVICRLKFSDLTLQEYWEKIKSTKMNPDEFVTVYTYHFLRK